MLRTITAAVLLFTLGVWAGACDDDTGKPCATDADCAEGLVCDEHDGQGTCQEPHGHETEGDGTDTDADTTDTHVG